MDGGLGAQLPDGVSGIPNVLNCASVYSASEFEKTKMFGPGGNFGLRCRETITLNIAVNKAEEGVIF